jgi:hypothetical protein
MSDDLIVRLVELRSAVDLLRRAEADPDGAATGVVRDAHEWVDEIAAQIADLPEVKALRLPD